jgi:hypothetical protein
MHSCFLNSNHTVSVSLSAPFPPHNWPYQTQIYLSQNSIIS